jgi:hypothetical protein
MQPDWTGAESTDFALKEGQISLNPEIAAFAKLKIFW